MTPRDERLRPLDETARRQGITIVAKGGSMAGTGRIYRRGTIYYIAYRWDGREYRESARSSEVADAERLLARGASRRLRA